MTVFEAKLFLTLLGLLACVRIPLSEPLTTSRQPAQLSILPKSVNGYSEVTLRGQAVLMQAHVGCIAAHVPNLRLQIERKGIFFISGGNNGLCVLGYFAWQPNAYRKMHCTNRCQTMVLQCKILLNIYCWVFDACDRR